MQKAESPMPMSLKAASQGARTQGGLQWNEPSQALEPKQLHCAVGTCKVMQQVEAICSTAFANWYTYYRSQEGRLATCAAQNNNKKTYSSTSG